MTEPTVEPTGSDSRATRPSRRASRSGATPEDRIAELEQRLQRLERSPGLRERGRSMMDRVIPPEAGDHFRAAGREQLLGIRSIVDHWIRKIDEGDLRAGRRERETIEID